MATKSPPDLSTLPPSRGPKTKKNKPSFKEAQPGSPEQEADNARHNDEIESRIGKVSIPKPDHPRLKADAFFAYMESIPADAWESRVLVYIYRVYPVIDRALAGIATRYIDKRGSLFSGKDILQSHGSGEYSLRMTDAAIRHRELCRCEFSVQDADYPPVLDPAELDMGHPKNKSYIEGLKSRGLLKEKDMNEAGGSTAALSSIAQQLLNDTRQNRRPNEPADKAADAVVTMMLKGQDAAMKMVETQAQANSPAGMMDFAKSMMELAGGGKGSDLTPLLFQMMMKQMETQAQMMTAILTKTPQKSNIEELTALMGLVEVLRPQAQGIGEKLLEIIPTALGQVGGIFQNTMQMSQANRAAAAGAPAPQPAAATPNPMESGMNIQALAQQLAPYIPMMVQSMNRGENGIQFAAAVESLLGPNGYLQLSNLGAANIIAAIKATPSWPQLAALEPQVIQFTNEFCAWQQEREKQEQETAENGN